MKKHLIRNLFLLFSFLPFIETFANWNSFIINFDKNLYGKGAQTWKIAPYDDKWVFFANKNGMLQFDGNAWNVFPLNNTSDVRSVLVSTAHNRIYAGGINEYGAQHRLLCLDAKGQSRIQIIQFRFHSVSSAFFFRTQSLQGAYSSVTCTLILAVTTGWSFTSAL